MALFFYFGDECPHCEKMKPVVESFEKETGLLVEKLEVWHNDENLQQLESISEQKECGGVPFLWNDQSRKSICGEASIEELKEWAKG